MEPFDEIQAIYDSEKRNQTQKSAEEIVDSARANLKKLKRDQFWTIMIMSVPLILLTYFFYKVGQFGDWKLISGLSLMIGPLLVRVVLEAWSKAKLRRIQTYLSTSEFLESVQHYFEGRKRIQKIFTPIIYLLYGVGIVLFLIAIKPYTSPFFFAYCVDTGIGFWIGFIWVIRYSYRKEWALLTELEQMSEE